MRVEAHRQHREKGTEISAISIAAKNGHLPAVHVLIAAGADVTSGNKVRNVCPTSTLSAPAESFFFIYAWAVFDSATSLGCRIRPCFSCVLASVVFGRSEC